MNINDIMASIEGELGFSVRSMARVHYLLGSKEIESSLKNQLLLNLWLSFSYISKDAKNHSRTHFETAKLLYQKMTTNAKMDLYFSMLSELLSANLNSSRVDEDLVSFSALEEKLISYLKAKRRDSVELIIHLYGENLDFEKSENKFKNLLFRLRKKIPGKILNRQGFYYWID